MLLGSLFGRKRKKPRGDASASENIKDAEKGDVFTVTGHALEYEDAYFIVEQVNRYSSAPGTWREVLGSDGENKVWVSWSEESGVQYVTVCPDDRPVGLEALGLSEDDMVRLDDEQSISNYITVDGHGLSTTGSAPRPPCTRAAGPGRRSTCGTWCRRTIREC